MTYTDVNPVLEGDAGARERYSKLVAGFERMRDLALILNRKRERRGSIDFDLPEPVIEFDEFGLMKSITRSERNMAHRLIEEFMLSANECVASYLENKRMASLYRIHEKPDAKRVYDFEVIAATFGYSLGVGPLADPAGATQDRPARKLRDGQAHPRDRDSERSAHHAAHVSEADRKDRRQAGGAHSFLPDAAVVEAGAIFRGEPGPLCPGRDGLYPFHVAHPPLSRPDHSPHPERSVARFAADRSAGVPPARRRTERPLWQSDSERPKKKDREKESRQRRVARKRIARRRLATLSKATGPVHKRASSPPSGRQDAGATSASPWSKRRDHSAHREAVQPEGGPIPIEELHDIAEESSQSERRADEAERELMEWKKVKFMQERVGEDFDGLIISVTKFGFFVELTDLFVEGLVPLDSLADDRYTYHENTREIIGLRSHKIYSLGQRIRVLVDRIDPVEKKIQFAVFEEKPAPKRKKR